MTSFQNAEGNWRQEMVTVWSKSVQPMLLGSVAIGGITQALPFLYRSFFADLHEYQEKGHSGDKKFIFFLRCNIALKYLNLVNFH